MSSGFWLVDILSSLWIGQSQDRILKFGLLTWFYNIGHMVPVYHFDLFIIWRWYGIAFEILHNSLTERTYNIEVESMQRLPISWVHFDFRPGIYFQLWLCICWYKHFGWKSRFVSSICNLYRKIRPLHAVNEAFKKTPVWNHLVL